MIDINKELESFKKAVYGEDMRSALVSAFNKFSKYALCGTGLNITFENKGDICEGDLNLIPTNTIYGVAAGANLKNSPSENAGLIAHIGKTDAATSSDVQIYFDIQNQIYLREYWSNSWRDWKNLTDWNAKIESDVTAKVRSITEKAIEEIKVETAGDISRLSESIADGIKASVKSNGKAITVSTLTDANSADLNTIYAINDGSIANLPVSKKGVLFTFSGIIFGSVTGGQVQLYATEEADMHIRTTAYKPYVQWSNWTRLQKADELANTTVNYSGKEICVFTKIACVGDSYTKGGVNVTSTSISDNQRYSYPSVLSRITGAEVLNYGLSGKSTKSLYEYYFGSTTAEERWKEMFSGCDAVIIALGINDYIRGIPVDNGISYIGQLVDKIKTQSPGAKIFISTIARSRWEASSGEQRDFYNKFNAAISKYASDTADCYLLDMSTYSMVVGNNLILGDHPTALGYRLMAQEYANYIGWVISKNISDFADIQLVK